MFEGPSWGQKTWTGPGVFSLAKTCKLNVHKEEKNLEVTEYRNGYESLISGMSTNVSSSE
jgi:hypothetical protein